MNQRPDSPKTRTTEEDAAGRLKALLSSARVPRAPDSLRSLLRGISEGGDEGVPPALRGLGPASTLRRRIGLREPARLVAVLALAVSMSAIALSIRNGEKPGLSATATLAPTTAPSTAGSAIQPSGSIVPWIDARPSPVSSATPALIPSGTATCAPSELTATAYWQGATGSMAGGIGVTNTNQRACVLNGSPRLVQLRSAATTLAPVSYRAAPQAGPGSSTGTAGPVLLRPGGQAGAFLLWENWCSAMIPGVTALLVTLPDGGSPIVATPTPPMTTIGSTPRCDVPTAGSILTAYAFAAVAPAQPMYEPQTATVSLSVPPTTTPGATLIFFVALTNRGTNPASLAPCPTYSEDLIVNGAAMKPPAEQRFLLNCIAIGEALAPGASVTLEMRYAVPAAIPSGSVELRWGMDPGGPFDTSSAIQHAPLTVTRP